VTGPVEKTRLDKWLWQARFFKTRAIAARLAGGGRIRVNGARIEKPAHQVAPGDVLTFPQARRVRVVRILALGERRGPAPEARALYEDMTEDAPENDVPRAPRYEGKGRPTKRDRRKLDRNDPGALD
jgi:ribosome-associated heat shock protein Hsp15